MSWRQNTEEEKRLFSACRDGDLETVMLLSRHVNAKDSDWSSLSYRPLHHAARCGRLNVVRYLVNEAHCDTNVIGDDGWTPLHCACMKSGHLDIVRYLVNEAHCDPDVKDYYRWTPLYYACKWGHLDVVRYLVNEAHCDPNDKNDYGQTPLHSACSEEHLDVVRCLVNEAHCDPNAKDYDGETPLDYACKEGYLDVVRYLVNEAHCDPNFKNNAGWTPLHYACRKGPLDVVRYLVNEAHCDPNVTSNDGWTPLHYACTSVHLDVVRYLVNEAHCDLNVKDNDGWTPLLCACRYGYLYVVRYLVNEAHCDTLCVTSNDGETPLHYACRNGHLDVVRYLVNEAHCDPKVKDNDGWTALHYACRWGDSNVAECLLIECHCDPNCTAKDGSTPLAVAKDTSIIRLLLQHGAMETDLYKYYGKILPGGILTHVKPAQSTVALFMVGDKGAGKNTLTKALMTEKKGIGSWAAKHIKCGGVKEKTAGIECHTVHSSRIGSFTIYDLAGHREFHNSHDTVIRSCTSSGMFLLVIDLTASLDDLKHTVSYWLSFIQSQVCAEASLQVSMPYLLAVGSHVDSVKSKADLEGNESVVRSLCETAGRINFVDYVVVDCRYSESPSLTQLRSHMRDTHDKLQSAPEVTFHAHCFHVYLVSQCGRKSGVKLTNLMKMIESNPDSEDSFLPQSLEELHETCKNVNRMGIMLYIQTVSIENNWIIIDKDVLLREVNGSIFAPEHFHEYKELTRTGVVPFSKICSTFDELIKTKEIEPELISDFLVHMEFCREMTEEDGLKLVTETHPKYKEERHFLFPALTPPNPPRDIWQPNPQINYSEYNSCWLLECYDYQHYLTSRFCEVLLLRLAFTHAFPMKPDEVDPSLHQHCTIWKYGIKWTTRSFVDALVEVDDKRVVLLLRCKEGKELSLVKVRSHVVTEILSVKDDFCNNAETVEKLALNPTHPVDMKSSVSLEISKIAHAISRHDDGVHLTAHSLVDLSDLLLFEPYKFCTPECLVDVYSNTPHKVTPHFLECITRNIKHDGFCTKLNISEEAVHMFQEWSQGTYQRLRQQMDHYSVFSGRDILKRAVTVAQIKPPSPPPPPLAVTLGKEPTLPKLLELDIPLQVSDKYDSFGTFLLNDTTGYKMEVIENDRQGAEDITRTILKKWLKGGGVSVSWESLIKVLRKCGLSLLAKQIEMAIKL